MDITRAPKTVATKMFAALTALLVATVAFASVASADPSVTTTHYDGLGPGHSQVYQGTEAAGSYQFTINGTTVYAFCADLVAPFNKDAAFTVVPAASTSIPGIASAGWVAANAATVGTPLADTDTEHAAIQVAIWSFTNNITIDAANVPSGQVRNRALELVAASAGQTVTSAPTALNVTATSAAVPSGVETTAVVTDDKGNPVANQDVTFTAAGVDVHSTTDATGVAKAVHAPATPGEKLDVAVSVTSQIVAGSVIVPDDSSQPLVLSDWIGFEAKAASSFVSPADKAEAPTPPPATTPDQPANTPVATTAEELPYTGGSLGLPHLIGALVVLAAAGFVITRFRNHAAA